MTLASTKLGGRWAWWALFTALGAAGCKDVRRFSTAPEESYCGRIVSAPMVKRGFGESVRMRLTFDADRVDSAPGVVSTDDGLLSDASMRPLPELSHDPLLTFSFGEGRDKNLLFAVDPSEAAKGPALFVVLSLMHTGDAEVRLVRGAPGSDERAEQDGAPLFGVFAPLHREAGRCSF